MIDSPDGPVHGRAVLVRVAAAAVLGMSAGSIAACEVAETPAPVSDDICDAPSVSVPLPPALEESSGVATSRTHPGIFWTHNDSGGDPIVFAVDSTGTIRSRVRVEGATNRDWEDVAVAACEPGSDDHCLFIAETGDNNARYPHVAVYRIPEPDPTAADTVSAPSDIFRFTYPDGPRDAEGLFVTTAGIHIVTKGRTGAIELFRLPAPYPSGTATIQLVQRLAPPPTSMSAQATAAAVDTDEQIVLIRTYVGLRFFQIEADTLRPHGRAADGVAPGQLQGEGTDFTTDGRIVLTSEAQTGRPQTLAIVRCEPTPGP